MYGERQGREGALVHQQTEQEIVIDALREDDEGMPNITQGEMVEREGGGRIRGWCTCGSCGVSERAAQRSHLFVAQLWMKEGRVR